MSSHRSLINNSVNSNRDPRNRDRSRSDIRRPNSSTDANLSLVTANLPSRQEPPTPDNLLLEFFNTLGLNSQVIQTLINVNLQNLQNVQQLSQPPLVNNAQEFASFLSKSYGLNSSITSTPNQSKNRDPRHHQKSPTVTSPISSTIILTHAALPSNSCSNSTITNSTLSQIADNASSSMTIDEAYKNHISTIDPSLLDDKIRKKFQRIALLDNELDRLYRMNIELTKNIERHSRRHESKKDKDPLLRENENLQNELFEYVKTLKTMIMNTYPTNMFNNNTVINRQ